MSGYTKKDEVRLAWDENREKIQLQGRQILRRVLNVALDVLDRKFKDAQHRGEILQLDYDKSELKALLRETANKELEPVNDRRRKT